MAETKGWLAGNPAENELRRIAQIPGSYELPQSFALHPQLPLDELALELQGLNPGPNGISGHAVRQAAPWQVRLNFFDSHDG